jgi:hypothetical protein
MEKAKLDIIAKIKADIDAGKIQDAFYSSVVAKIKEMIKAGKITAASPSEYIAQKANDLTRKMPLFNTNGILNEIAMGIGIGVGENDPDIPAPAVYKIRDLASIADSHDDRVISIVVKVIDGMVDEIPKTDKEDNPVMVKGEDGEVQDKWRIAKLEVADDTGMALFSQFYGSGLEELFQDIDNIHKKPGESALGKVYELKNVKIERSRYSGHEIQISLKKGGSIDFANVDIPTVATKISTTPVKSARQGDVHFFLLKVMKQEERTTKAGKSFKKFNCIDSENSWIGVTIWCKIDAEIENGSVVLVEGKVKESAGKDGRVFKDVQVNRPNQIRVNPAGYEMTVKGKDVSKKKLINAEIGDIIEVTVLFKRFFGGKSKPYYVACPVITDSAKNRSCMKSVKFNDEKKTWECGGGHSLSEEESNEAKRVIIISGIVTDGIELPFKIFDHGTEQRTDGTIKESVIQVLTGKTTDEFIADYDRVNGDESFFDKLAQEVTGKYFTITASVDKDDYRGSISLGINSIKKADVPFEIKTIKDSLSITV